MRTAVVGAGLTGWVLISALNVSAADRPWTEVKTAHFTVVSDAGDKSARTIVWQLEQVRAAVKTFWPWARTDLDRPVVVLIPRDESGMRSLAPRYWEEKGSVRPASVFVTAPDRHFIALQGDVKADDRGGIINPYVTAYWSYLSIILRSSGYYQLPLWLSLGLTEVMSNTIVRDTHLEVGRPLPWHLQRLRQHTRLPVSDLLSVTTTSPWYVREDQRRDLDASAWALVHYLMFADERAHSEQLDRFAQLITEGKTPAAAAELVFGDLSALERGFSTYATRQLFNFGRFNVDLAVKPEGFSSRSLSPGETAIAQAAFHTAMRRPVEARHLLEEAKKSDAKLAGVYEVEGRLLETEGKSEEARAAYGRAVELGSTNFYAHYRWAALTLGPAMNDAETRTRVDHALEEALKLNDRFAPTYATIAGARLQAGRRDDALTFAQRGVALDPTRFENRLTLARVLWGLSRRTEAVREAREALALGQSDEQRRAAQQLIDFFEKNSSL